MTSNEPILKRFCTSHVYPITAAAVSHVISRDVIFWWLLAGDEEDEVCGEGSARLRAAGGMASLSPGEEDMESASEGDGGWNEVRTKTSRKKIDMSCDSLSESDSQNELKKVKKRIENEEWKVVVEFGEQSSAKLHPVALTKAIH